MKSLLPLLGLIFVAASPINAEIRPKPLQNSDFTAHSPAEIKLGQLLFWDAELSGNRNISCGTCHHPRFGTGDGVSLGMGEGGIGLGPSRHIDANDPPEQRIPRNAPGLFNLGITDLRNLFYDGRIETDSSRANGFRTPLEDEMVTGFASVLSAQSMFPVLSPDEMAGHYAENEISKAVRTGQLTGPDGAWQRIAVRISAIPEYRAMFDAAYPEIKAGRAIHFTDISNAIAAFITFEWRSDAAPFDAWLRDEAPLPDAAATGAALFYGKAGCSDCHSGPLLTDQGFHAMGSPQLGPGKTERFETNQRDIGRMRVTNHAEDAYAFRTPSLRNVTASAPYGHAGAHSDLRAFVEYHLNPAKGLANYTPQAVLPDFAADKEDWAITHDPGEIAAITAAIKTPPVDLTSAEVTAIMAFLDSLTDPAALHGRLGIPDKVPSGLTIDR
ncbi:cytochrome-c peroxidase [Pseudorhodobacter sp.]|uniref:cytochrome-c peroxidase n=1 Tax=Pseudorhodobacter sp. TaxID=1934400 RepID=UPI002649577F|nr:cytochrome c peroxidase [Pseudorhodobacter sp.]MDN5787946.1 cytochrome-c peroxidase [Pseudorhodobacter sp.]